MWNNIIGVIISFVYFFGIVLIPRILPIKNKEFARKFVHVMIGNWWFILLIFFTDGIYALIVPAAFVFVNYFSIKRKKENGLLAAYERKEDAAMSYGIILYPISLIIMVAISYFFTNEHYLGGIGVIALAYGDGFAALVGKKWPWVEFHVGQANKTLSGSLSMLFITAIMMIVYLLIVEQIPIDRMIFSVILVAILTTVVEAVTPNGFDNLTVPITASTTFVLCMNII